MRTSTHLVQTRALPLQTILPSNYSAFLHNLPSQQATIAKQSIVYHTSPFLFTISFKNYTLSQHALYLTNHIYDLVPTHTLHSSNQHLLEIPDVCSPVGHWFFTLAAWTIWRTLPSFFSFYFHFLYHPQHPPWAILVSPFPITHSPCVIFCCFSPPPPLLVFLTPPLPV